MVAKEAEAMEVGVAGVVTEGARVAARVVAKLVAYHTRSNSPQESSKRSPHKKWIQLLRLRTTRTLRTQSN